MAKMKEIKVINYITLRDPVHGDSETVRMDALNSEEKQRIGILLHNQDMNARGYELENKDDLQPLTDEEKEYWRKRFAEINKQNEMAV